MRLGCKPPGERNTIRRELDRFFPALPSVADGLQLGTWRGGPQAGQPKVPLVARGLLERGLMRLQLTPWPPRLFFTEAGHLVLRAMMADRRLANPATFAHVRQELGIDPAPEKAERNTIASEAGRPRRGLAADATTVACSPWPASTRPRLGLTHRLPS